MTIRNVGLFLVSICLLITLGSAAVAQDRPASLVASASGEGKIKLGQEEFKLNAVVVKLSEDGKAELNLITDITVFIEGTWSRSADNNNTIDLKITGNALSGTLDGTGKLFITDDRKSFTGLKLEVLNKTTRKTVAADFTAK